jgi:hypothetical protein
MTDTQVRSRILRRIQKLSSDKLREIEDFVAKLESPTSKKGKNLSFAGAWKDIEETTFNDFTDKLIEKRQQNRRRINE